MHIIGGLRVGIRITFIILGNNLYARCVFILLFFPFLYYYYRTTSRLYPSGFPINARFLPENIVLLYYYHTHTQTPILMCVCVCVRCTKDIIINNIIYERL